MFIGDANEMLTSGTNPCLVAMQMKCWYVWRNCIILTWKIIQRFAPVWCAVIFIWNFPAKEKNKEIATIIVSTRFRKSCKHESSCDLSQSYHPWCPFFVRQAILSSSPFETFDFWHSIETNFSIWNQGCQLFVFPLCFPRVEQIQILF